MASFGPSRGRGNNRVGRGSSKQTQTNSASQPRLQVCRNFASTGNCNHGERCKFSHVVKLHASVLVSDKIKDSKSNFHKGYGGNSKSKENHKVTSVAVWETNGVVKIFTGSHDGKWRLWDTSAVMGGTGLNLTREFEQDVGGPVDAVHVKSHYFFCGFEASPAIAPDAKAGMVHSWNLNAARDPPMELWMSSMAKYAGSGRIRSLWTTADGSVWSGGSDGVIRQWAFNPTGGVGGKGGFAFVRNMCGHLGAVTGLTLLKGVLWSGGMDGTLRLWNVDSGNGAYLVPAGKNGVVSEKLPGHSGPVTGLLSFEICQDSFVFSSSLDETVKVWNAVNGECVASEQHGQGVTAISLIHDLKGNQLLLCGLFYGDIMIRATISNPPLCLLLKLAHNFIGVGHELGPVNDVQTGPDNTFYAVADDGKLTAWQIVGDFDL
mmetsp:Transcript_45070/g.94508  ORF Transcript_45070/g.94508 Transcript_45070/m.94508 type:complete len:433 (-) Transcript_45070:193-1491(-)